MQGKLIVIEGLDGSGKATQTSLLFDALKAEGKSLRKLEYPNYENRSSTLVTMYLNGEVGELGVVNPYAASLFYCCDRYISFLQGWKKDYEDGMNFIADRYISSNVVYQMPKLPMHEWDDYIAWLEETENIRCKLPIPDLVIYLDVRPEVARRLMEERSKKDGIPLDLHESKLGFQMTSRGGALFAAESQGWKVIDCCDVAGNLLTISMIHEKVLAEARKIFD